MKYLVWIVALAAAIGSGLWLLGARGTERATAAWLDARAAEGWLVEYAALDTGGFPTRFETVFTDLQLADPVTGWAWSAPELALTQRVHRPDHIRADWPAQQVLASPFERVDITAGAIWSEIDVQPTANLALDASVTGLSSVTLSSNAGWNMTLETGQLEVRRVDGTDTSYEVLFDAAGLVPPAETAARVDPAGILPERIERMRYEAVMQFDRPWDLSALERARPQITRIDLTEMRAQWGPLLFRASGEVDVDDQGRATGQIAIRAENWREMLDIATNAGVLGEGLRGTAETALGFVAGLSGRDEDIDATLRLSEGFVFLGPLPIGEAPRLILR